MSIEGKGSVTQTTFTTFRAHYKFFTFMRKYLLALSALLMTGLWMSAQLVGNPTVTYTIDEITTTGYKITFTPNEDVAGYAACQFDAGTAQQQFDMFGAWMGFTSMGDMVMAWGFNETTE